MRRRISATTILTALAISNAAAQQSIEMPDTQFSANGRVTEPIANDNNAPGRATALNNAFTYQGSLMDGGIPANGEYDIRFLLYDDLGAIVAGPTCHDNVMVVDGVFSAQIDLGDQFFGDVRELELAIRSGGAIGNCATGGGYTTLSPRQEITATPYALGLRLPYAGRQSDVESIFSILNTNEDADSSIHGILGASVPYPSDIGAGVRGEGTGVSSAGVLGISQDHIGVVGYGVGPFTIGVVGWTDGADGIGLYGEATQAGGTGIFGIATGLDRWAGQFHGRTYFNGNVGIGILEPTTSLDVDGTIRTAALQIPTNPGVGKVLKSDALGNATWQTANQADFVSNFAPAPTISIQFLSAITTVTITEGQSIFVTSNRAFGTTVVGGAHDLRLYIGYRLSGSPDTPAQVGGGMLALRLPQGSRVPFGITGIISGLAPGTYEVGMIGRTTGNDGSNWNSNDWGYTSAIVLD